MKIQNSKYAVKQKKKDNSKYK